MERGEGEAGLPHYNTWCETPDIMTNEYLTNITSQSQKMINGRWNERYGGEVQVSA